jgi:hypothetical protein
MDRLLTEVSGWYKSITFVSADAATMSLGGFDSLDDGVAFFCRPLTSTLVDDRSDFESQNCRAAAGAEGGEP